MTHSQFKLICLAIAFFISFTALGQQEADRRTKEYNLDDHVAISGYDPVAYFTQNKAVKGNPANTFTYEGVQYHFSTKANLETFRKDPAKYEPAYGGWCAFAMGSAGQKVEIDPETFKVKDGRLYLFYNQFLNNTLPKWNADEAKLNKQADANWKKIYP